MEAARYRGESQHFTYEIYVLIFQKNMRILSSNNEAMLDSRSAQKFLLGIKFSWFAAGKYFVTILDAHQNDFAKTTAYLASFVQRGKGGGQKIYAFHAQGSVGGRHRRRFGCSGRGRGGRNRRGVHGVRGGSGDRGGKPDIAAISYTYQEWALLRYDYKGKVFALRDKAKPRKINAVEISEASISKIAKIADRQKYGSAVTGEKQSPGNRMTGKIHGSA